MVRFRSTSTSANTKVRKRSSYQGFIKDGNSKVIQECGNTEKEVKTPQYKFRVLLFNIMPSRTCLPTLQINSHTKMRVPAMPLPPTRAVIHLYMGLCVRS